MTPEQEQRALEAEATRKSAIFDGIVSAWRGGPEAVRDAVHDSIRRPEVAWAFASPLDAARLRVVEAAKAWNQNDVDWEPLVDAVDALLALEKEGP